jgi:hypothetical protein
VAARPATSVRLKSNDRTEKALQMAARPRALIPSLRAIQHRQQEVRICRSFEAL